MSTKSYLFVHISFNVFSLESYNNSSRLEYSALRYIDLICSGRLPTASYAASGRNRGLKASFRVVGEILKFA